MLATPAPHKQLRHLVADQIRDAILNGQFKPGEWLRQEHIAQELGVSQMPVREALKELASEGLIEHVPYRGARVVEFSADDVEDLYATRAFLEARAAGIAATRITTEELTELRRLQNELQRVSAPDQVQAYRETNRKFHELIFKASRRTYLIRTLSQLWAAFPTMLIGNFSRTAASPLDGRDSVDIQEHERIIAALEAGDPDAAQQMMYQHIESVMHEFVEVLQKNTDKA